MLQRAVWSHTLLPSDKAVDLLLPGWCAAVRKNGAGTLLKQEPYSSSCDSTSAKVTRGGKLALQALLQLSTGSCPIAFAWRAVWGVEQNGGQLLAAKMCTGCQVQVTDYWMQQGRQALQPSRQGPARTNTDKPTPWADMFDRWRPGVGPCSWHRAVPCADPSTCAHPLRSRSPTQPGLATPPPPPPPLGNPGCPLALYSWLTSNDACALCPTLAIRHHGVGCDRV